MADDVLKKFSVQQVHGWYERLARKVDAQAKSQGVSAPMSGTWQESHLRALHIDSCLMATS